jgi:hypothetical protein
MAGLDVDDRGDVGVPCSDNMIALFVRLLCLLGKDDQQDFFGCPGKCSMRRSWLCNNVRHRAGLAPPHLRDNVVKPSRRMILGKRGPILMRKCHQVTGPDPWFHLTIYSQYARL